MIKVLQGIIKFGLKGYNSFVWRVSLSGQFLWSLMQKYDVQDVVIVIDGQTSKWNRVISDMMFLHRKGRLNVRVINIDREELETEMMKDAFLISFVDESDSGVIALGCRIADTEVADERALFAGKFLDTGKWIALYDQEIQNFVERGLDSRIREDDTEDRNDKKSRTVKALKIQAIVTCYNEEDIIDHTIQYLIDQGIYVHIINNWSTDKSDDIIAKWTADNSFVTAEKYPAEGPSKTYDWMELLTRAQNHAMAHHTEFDWFVHHDADEIREAPFRDCESLAEGIAVVDALGYSAINHTVLDFIPPEDVIAKEPFARAKFRHFSFGQGRAYNEQIKAWKSHAEIDLVTAGGHFVHFVGQKIFPYNFVLLHYPLRSLAQAQKKIFTDRKARWNTSERKRKWHRHYDTYNSEKDLTWDREQYLVYNRADVSRNHITKMLGNIAQKSLRSPKK